MQARTVTVHVPTLRVVALLLGVTLSLALLWSVGRAWAVGDGEVPDVIVLARSDNPVDALGASSQAGQLGAPVLLTPPDELGPDAAAVLSARSPDVVVLAGGTVALSDRVETAVRDLLPSARVERVAGATREGTAAALADLGDLLDFGRPALTRTAVGDVAAELDRLQAQVEAVAGTDVSAMAERLDQLEGTVTALQGTVADQATTIGTLTATVADLQTTLAGVTRDGDLLAFSGMNVRVDNGTGSTVGVPNGLGNLIVGFDEQRIPAATRTGSHYLVVGPEHEYTAFGGIVAGIHHTASGGFASVIGGASNTANGLSASVSGGQNNTASGQFASVFGGSGNTASGQYASVSGGTGNTATDQYASVSGGVGNAADGYGASVAGGVGNTVTGSYSSLLGGSAQTLGGVAATYPAGP